ncbi:hypothetical protein FQN57_000329 [Myotisia sp. PD_48]|nr:hypothetical protein FQN57_000329 [Myotisia sp. PD_48]
MAGSTGNVYTIVIGKVPRCSCPDYGNGNQCKHIIYVRVPSDSSTAIQLIPRLVLRKVLNVGKVGAYLEYQRAFLSSELREIFRKNPSTTPVTVLEEDSEVEQKELDGECPICFVSFDDESEEIVWSGLDSREPWQDDETVQSLLQTATYNEGGYLNIGDALGLPSDRDYSGSCRSAGSQEWSYYY